MNPELVKYILDHTTPEDPLLEELFRQTNLRFVNPNRSSDHVQGRVLEMISRMIGPYRVLEIGTFTGYSTICLAKGLRPGGRLITVDPDDEMDEFARSYFKKAGLENRIEKITGRFQDVVETINEEFDLVFIDGDKREYSEYFKLAIKKVRPGGFILADNVLWGGKITTNETRDAQTRGIIEFNEMVKDLEDVETLILPVRDGLMIIWKK